MPNATLGVRRRQDSGRDAHGERLPAPWGPINGPQPGRKKEDADANWALGVDPDQWPVRQGDLVVDVDSGQSWLVDSANLVRNNLDPSVDWVRITGRHRTVGGTEPGGAWFVARHEPYVDPAPAEPGSVTETSPGLWIGSGPPPDPDPATFPAEPGDEYIDTDTGIVYRLMDS